MTSIVIIANWNLFHFRSSYIKENASNQFKIRHLDRCTSQILAEKLKRKIEKNWNYFSIILGITFCVCHSPKQTQIESNNNCNFHDFEAYALSSNLVFDRAIFVCVCKIISMQINSIQCINLVEEQFSFSKILNHWFCIRWKRGQNRKPNFWIFMKLNGKKNSTSTYHPCETLSQNSIWIALLF